MDTFSTDPTQATYSTLQHAYSFFNSELFEGSLPEVIFTYSRIGRVMGYATIARWVNSSSQKIDEVSINPEYFAKHPLIEICQTLCHEMVHIWQAHFGRPSRRGYHNREWAAKMESLGLKASSTGKPGGDETGESMMDYVLLFDRFHCAFIKLVETGYELPWMDRYPIFRVEGPVLAYDLEGQSYALDKHFKPESGKSIPLSMSKTSSLDGLPYSEVELARLADVIEEEIDRPRWSDLYGNNDDGLDSLFSSKPVQKSGRVKYVCKCCHAQVWGKPHLNIGCLDCQREMEEKT